MKSWGKRKNCREPKPCRSWIPREGTQGGRPGFNATQLKSRSDRLRLAVLPGHLEGCGHCDHPPGAVTAIANGVPKPDCEESVNSAEPETAEYPGVLSISRRKNFSRRPASHSTSPIWCHQGCETLTKMVRGLSAAQEGIESQPFQPCGGWKPLVRRNRCADSRYFAEDLAHRPISGHIKPLSPTGPTITPSSLCFPSHQLREVWTAKPSIWKTVHTACQIKNKHAGGVFYRIRRWNPSAAAATRAARPSVPGSGTAVGLPRLPAEAAAGK